MNEVQRYYAANERLDVARKQGKEGRIRRLTAWVDKLTEEAQEVLHDREQRVDQAIRGLKESVRAAFSSSTTKAA